ncbi:hypothetical protein PAE9249_02322 [Paenibacillus sp. CECT 9249]|uniref:TIGR02530 family flagellar biosynthesis protein n=1 Tax=Paenibacillus sp. CECT 9249 TaxID=2845385 RepID=UPI001E61265C|nr:TIGR02530 family flagellar biosynthesis protein [Paenibacillus sp. CECT 9249]CAH0119814.1 hypothetical protein PAE9249_02322 [Paenibacillus sp. CECT 9249]
MTDRLTIGQLYPGKVPPAAVRNKALVPAYPPNGPSFQRLLENELVRFSQHAEMRLAQRGIELQPDHLTKIGSAIDKAASKGAKDSLIIMSDMAFIVNVKNRTVVTAMDSASMQDNVFTQIDSAIVVS